jgi:hypothetical protein
MAKAITGMAKAIGVSKESQTMNSDAVSGEVRKPLSRRAIRVAFAAAIGWVIALVLATSALASQSITEFSVASSDQRAGAHPDLTARFRVEKPGEPEVISNVTVDFPQGVFGNPGAVFRCRAAIFVLNQCQAGAQVGVITIVGSYEGNPNYVFGTTPIYNMQVLGDESARLAFVVPVVDVPVIVPIKVRSDSDYGLRMSINSISQTVALGFASMTVWGFPADSEHDPERFYPGNPGEPPACPGSLAVDCISAPFPRAGVVVRPFIDNPSVCTAAPLPVTVQVTTYQDPNPSTESSSYAPTTGCEGQKFDPVFNTALTNPQGDAPSGLDFQLKAAQFLEGKAPTQSTLRSATVELPPGLTVNPDAADGQTSCKEVAEAHFGSNLPGECPDNSKIGTVEVRTPALEDPLFGSLYIGEPLPGDQYRVFMIFDGFGIHAKLPVSVHPDPITGQVTMSTADLPQVPFEEFNMHLFASDRGLMATPTRCGLYEAAASMVPWNGTLASQQSGPFVAVAEGANGRSCPGLVRPFNPRLVAGTSNPRAGDFSSFTLKLDRDDGDQFLGDLTFRMPPGFTGDLRGISYCPDASIAAAAANLGRTEQVNASCPASSQIGTTNVAAGPGEHPFHAVGKMYLAGPLKGAPLSLVAVTPALAGPYDYGVVVVRVALHVDPQTAQVFAASDTVPAIIGGIPIRMRSIQVNIDKPNFTINPTNCSPFTVDSQGIGDQGTVTDFSSYFQVVNCGHLPFKPKMIVKQIGRKGTRRATNPQVQFDLTTRPGDANIKSLSVTLSSAFEIDQRHLGNICSEKELTEKQCAGRTPIGKATTTTPLLDQPLSGPVYAVSGSGGLPRLAFILNGQVNLVPRADTQTVGGGRLQTTVPVVPDAPIGHFHLIVFGGKTGYLINTRDICVHTPVTQVAYTAQNGKTLSESVKVKAACGKKSKKPRHKRTARR